MRWTTLLSLVVIGLVATGCGSGSEESAQNTNKQPTPKAQPALKVSNSCAPLSSFFSELLNFTNQARAEVDADPLSFSFQLGRSAQAYAEDLATQNFFSHSGKDGSTFKSRIAATGYDFENAGENLVAGSNYTAENAFNAWMNSSEGHRENLLSKSFTEVGFGLFDATGSSTYGRYWVQHLGTPESGQSKGGVYIPDDCGLVTANASVVDGASAVAGRSIFGNQGNSTSGTMPVNLLASKVETIVPQHSNGAEDVPEPGLMMGLGVLGMALWRTERWRTER
ncbi:MAG: CAP domain-containing protein [Phormidesmis sp.]